MTDKKINETQNSIYSIIGESTEFPSARIKHEITPPKDTTKPKEK